MSNMLIRDKKTFEVHIHRNGEFSTPGRPFVHVPRAERTLHYVGSDRSIVCRCAAREGHYLKTFPVSDESKYLNASFLLYMDRFDFESCKIADFNTFQVKQKSTWKKLGVYIDDFHYSHKEKNVLCRCINPGSHSYGGVRNPEIIWLCARFFEVYNDALTCSKKDWRGIGEQGRGTSSKNHSSLLYDRLQRLTVQDSPVTIGHSGGRVSAQNDSDHDRAIALSTSSGTLCPSSQAQTQESHPSHAPLFDPLDSAQCPSTDLSRSHVQNDVTAEDEACHSSTYSGYRHTATLQQLEGYRETNSSNPPGKKIATRISQLEGSRNRLTSLFKQPSSADTLPSQDELLGNRAVNSESGPSFRVDCQLCKQPYQCSPQHTLRLAKCGHGFHEQCLLASFRIKDSDTGTCPVCSQAVCVRTLANRIETDQQAIFGMAYTDIGKSIDIEFPHHNQTVSCMSAELVAVAHLRLMKDYVDVHAEELYRHWEHNTHEEPDWHGGIVEPVVKLLQGWNYTSETRLFSDRGTFLELVAWAELVRLMNTTRAAIRHIEGRDSPYPQLEQLYRFFESAQIRFESKKDELQANCIDVLECDKIAQDVIEIAKATQIY